ncbi:MAG TPA: NAD(P)-dependent alcohol dehydrogenase [Zeimonas sp.]
MRVQEIADDWGLEHVRRGTRPDPEPRRGEVLLKMRASSLNYRDLVVLKGGYGRQTGTLPLVPLSDGVGEVVAVGEDVDRVGVGERVCPMFFPRWIGGEPDASRLMHSLGGPLDGTMAEFLRVPQEALARVPPALDDEQAASLPCAALTAWSALAVLGTTRPGDHVLVQGSGGVSLFALQFAQLFGARVTVISSSDEKIERLRAIGACAAVNYRRTPEWAKAARETTDGRGFDHIVEVGGEKTLPQSLRCIRPGGTISMIGVLSGAGITGSIGHVVTRAVRLQGITVGHRDAFEAMCRAIERHRVEPVVDRVFGFDELVDAYEHLASGKHFGKVCLSHQG